MSELDSSVSKRPLNSLKIPGTHNSFSYSLTRTSEFSPDTDLPDALHYLPRFLVAPIVHAWSKTQCATLEEQLIAGIRYFDFRIGLRRFPIGHEKLRKRRKRRSISKSFASDSSPTVNSLSSTPERTNLDYQDRSTQSGKEFYLLHGMWANSLRSELEVIKQFVTTHPKEVVIVDCNHFYEIEMSSEKQAFVELINEVLGDLLYSKQQNIPSLDEIWQSNKSIILISHLKNSFIVDRRIWPSSSIDSKWANTGSTEELIAYLNSSDGHSPNNFLVHQGILSFTPLEILSTPSDSLRSAVKPAGKLYIDWLRKSSSRVNIALIDFALYDQPDYVGVVVGLNKPDKPLNFRYYYSSNPFVNTVLNAVQAILSKF